MFWRRISYPEEQVVIMSYRCWLKEKFSLQECKKRGPLGLLTKARIPVSLVWSMSSFYLLPWTVGSRDYHVRSQGFISVTKKYRVLWKSSKLDKIQRRHNFCSWEGFYSCVFENSNCNGKLACQSIHQINLLSLCRQAVPPGMLSCHHDDTDQLSNVGRCHGNDLAVTSLTALGFCLL